MYTEFELVVPSSIDDALSELGRAGERALVIAGGTNLIVDMRARRVKPDKLVSLANVKGLKQIRVVNDQVEIGGATTISDILYSAAMPDLAPALHAAAQVFGGQMVRNAATIAGNICSGSPAADTVAPLLTLDAQLTLAGPAGTREVKLADFYTGFKQDVRAEDEIVTRIAWQKPRVNTKNFFYKLGLRKGDAITVAGVATALTVTDGVCRRARIAFCSGAPVVKRATGAEQLLENSTLTAELIGEAAALTVEATRPIDDYRASAAYRRHAIRVLTHRLLDQAWPRPA